MDPEKLREWPAILRDFAIVGLAAFMMIYGTTSIHDPTALGIVLGAGCTLLGVPAAIRLDSSRRKAKNENGDDERWSHLP